MKYRYKFVASFASLCVLSGAAQAQSGSSAVAQALFDQGKQLMATGHGAEACPKFEESQHLDPRTGTLLNLANCYELTERIASAWSTFIEAGSSAKASGNAGRQKLARDRAALLAPRLSKLTIVVAPALQGVAGLEITRDGLTVNAPEWGVALPADAGEHTVTAKAPGYSPFTATASVVGERTTATVNVRELVALPPETVTPPKKRGPSLQEDRHAVPPRKQESGLGTQRTVAAVAGGVGAVGLGLGTVFGFVSKSKHDAKAQYCNGDACTDPRGVSDGDAARNAGNVSTVLMIVGGAGLAAGATLWFTAAKKSDTPSAQVGLGFGAVQLKAAF